MAEEQDRLAWLDAARQGDGEALSRLLAAVRPEIVRYLESKLASHPSSHALAEELAQDTLVRVANAVRECRAETVGQLKAWLKTIARRRTIDHYRRRQQELEARAWSVWDEGERASSTAWQEAREARISLVDEDASEAEAALGELLLEAQAVLSEGTQEVLRRRILYGDTWAEAGRSAGTTAGGARRRWQRAQVRLRREVLRRAESLPADIRQEVLRLIGEGALCRTDPRS